MDLNAKESSPPFTSSQPTPFFFALPPFPLWVINASCLAWIPAKALTRLLFYHREPGMAEIHGHLDTVHKSFKEKLQRKQSRVWHTRNKWCSKLSFTLKRDTDKMYFLWCDKAETHMEVRYANIVTVQQKKAKQTQQSLNKLRIMFNCVSVQLNTTVNQCGDMKQCSKLGNYSLFFQSVLLSSVSPSFSCRLGYK